MLARHIGLRGEEAAEPLLCRAQLSVMIVLLDTTVFGADALCGGDAWQTLVLAAPIWGVRIVTTEVVIEEAIGNYEREVKAARTGLKRWADKRLGTLGLWDAFRSADEVLADGAAHYAERLRDRLTAANIQVLPVAEIPHIDLVKRASARRRPCNDKGDGYRDTLNWLILLELAGAEKEPIIWVSANTTDFGSGRDDGGLEFHPQLVEDLEPVAALDRVSWQLTLADVVISLAAEHALGSESDIKQIKEKVRNASVLEFLERELIPSAIRQRVNARQCALPRETISASFRAMENVRNLKLTLKGIVPGERGIAEFTVEVDAGIDATLVLPADPSGTEAVTSSRYINKPLLLRGLLTLGQFGNPEGAEIANIESMPDDPGRSEWQAYLAASDALRTLAEALRPMQQNQEAFRRMAEALRPMQQNQEAFRRMAEAIGSFQQNQEIFRRWGAGTGAQTPSDENADPETDDDHEGGEDDDK